jgi:tripartite-type tricarboxylate transporter receptor subunit TctC
MRISNCFCCIFLLLAGASGAAHAQPQKGEAGFPARPVRLLVTQAAGGPTDVVARLYATRLSELMGQQAVVDNRHSAGGAIAGELTARAPADGYTLMVAANGTMAVAPHLVKLTFDSRKDLTPVVLLGNSPLGLLVHPPLPAQSVKELVALAKARPGKINFGSPGTGATAHLAGELFKMLGSVNIVHVPYKGASPALVGVMSGEIEMMITGLSSGLPYVKQKQVRILGVTSAKRLALIPDVPAIAETLPGYEVASWYAVFAPAGTPRGIIERLHQLSMAAITTPDVQTRLAAVGVEVEAITPQQLGVKLARDYERWGKVVAAAGMKAQ